MQLRERFKKWKRARFQRFNIVFPILLAGWVPSILTLVVSYTILTKTLESKILRDRQTFVQLIGHLVGDDLGRTGGIIEYYQTLPEVAKMLTGASPQAATQQWLGSVFYSHPRVDGMFVTSPDGRLMASVPHIPEMIGKDFGSENWRAQAESSSAVVVSPVHRRLPDQRLVTDIVGAVRTPDRRIVGYLGVSVLVERIGRRLSTIDFADQSLCEVYDQKGVALFDKDFQPNPSSAFSARELLITQIGKSKGGHFELGGYIYSFSPVQSTGWVAVMEQPKAVAYKPVHDLLNKMNYLVGWLLIATAVGAWGTRYLFQRHTEATRRIEREVIFNENILANMPSGIAFVDPTSRRFLQANEAFVQMARRFGGLPANRDILKTTYGEVKIAPLDELEKVLALGTPFQLVEHPIKDKAGMTHFVDISLIRLEDSHKNVQGVLYLIEDKTRDMTLRQELIGANAAKDQFLALLSHELRNPLTPVIAMVSELEATMPASPDVWRALEVIRRNVELEARLIDDLLDVTRIAKGKLQLSFEVVSVHEILQRAYEICAEDIATKKLQTEFRLRAAHAHVQGDPARLQQVFWNLIKNSVKFTPENGSIIIETGNPASDEIEIRITDTGIGIEQEKIDKIFNAFEQGQSSITGASAASVSVSPFRRRWSMHTAGKFDVQSPGKNKGATFSIKLNTVPAPAAGDIGKGRREPARLGKRVPNGDKNGKARPAGGDGERQKERVPDHTVAAPCGGRSSGHVHGMKMMLERRGYQITLAHSAEQAVEKARMQDFDLLISDIGLPDRSGYELMKELRNSKGLRGIALSGFGMEHDVSKARAAGFSEHLTKPINFDRLEEAIQNLLA